jgi:hypothetical protein
MAKTIISGLAHHLTKPHMNQVLLLFFAKVQGPFAQLLYPYQKQDTVDIFGALAYQSL